MSTATFPAPATSESVTVEQFAALRCADTEDYELVEGVLVPLSSGTPMHAKIRSRVERLIGDYLAKNPVGDVFAEIDCRLTPQLVRRPDVSVFLGTATEFDANRIPVPHAPTIAIEILSPSESIVDVNRKSLEYLAGGSQEVWLLDSANDLVMLQTSQSMRLLRGNDKLESPLLPGFSPLVSELFSAA